MEQGTQLMRDSEFFPAAEKALGARLRVIEQGNLGGSGGYARGQMESVRKGTATYALMMDDDVVCEPEGIIRAVTFGDLARRPTIVGGHMFSLYSRSRLHSFGEIVQPWRFWWMTRLDGYSDWDFAARNLRSARWLHKRVDVDYNGWFMCLIPRAVLEQIGLSLPLFIKWDDSEFGLRAKAAGYPTVSLPGRRGLARPVDRQERRRSTGRPTSTSATGSSRRCCTRRTLAAAGWCARAFNHQVKHLVSMQYSTVEMRHQALEDVLAGPDALHGELPTKLAEVRAADERVQRRAAQGRPGRRSRRCVARSRPRGARTTSRSRAGSPR